MKSALIVGIDATIGALLQQELTAAGYTVLGTTRKKQNLIPQRIFYLDLLHCENFSFTPIVDVVYLCASITQMAQCNQDPQNSKQINFTAQLSLATYFLKKNVQVVFLSSNAVFNGKKCGYLENDPPSPVSLYGEYKAAAEKKMLEISNNVSIIRLTKVLTANHPLIIAWIKALSQSKPINAFDDRMVCPITVHDVTRCLKVIGEKKLTGILHLSGEKDITYYELAQHLADLIGADKTLIRPTSASHTELSTNARLRYTRLDMTQSKEILGVASPPIAALLNNLYGKVRCSL